MTVVGHKHLYVIEMKICCTMLRQICYYMAKFDTMDYLPLQMLMDRVEVYTGHIEEYLKQPNLPRFHKVSKMYNLVSY